MIRLLDASECDGAIELCAHDPIGIRISAALRSYGTGYDFARFWIGETQGAVTCVFSRVDGDMTCFFAGQHDMEEVRCFAQAVGFRTFMCEASRVWTSDGAETRYFNIMRYGRRHVAVPGARRLKTDPPLTEVWRIISSAGELGLDESLRDVWYADMSHRIRHSAARAFTLDSDAALCTSGETAYGSLISGVAVRPEMRGRGLGGRIVREASEILSDGGRDVFLMCSEKLVPFYKENGYGRYGSAAVIT